MVYQYAESDSYEMRDTYEGYDASDAAFDTYEEELSKFWYATRTIDKDYDDLNGYEMAQLQRDYSAEMESQEAYTNPNKYYMLSR